MAIAEMVPKVDRGKLRRQSRPNFFTMSRCSLLCIANVIPHCQTRYRFTVYGIAEKFKFRHYTFRQYFLHSVFG
jgi:hypothetical protein